MMFILPFTSLFIILFPVWNNPLLILLDLFNSSKSIADKKKVNRNIQGLIEQINPLTQTL